MTVKNNVVYMMDIQVMESFTCNDLNLSLREKTIVSKRLSTILVT